MEEVSHDLCIEQTTNEKTHKSVKSCFRLKNEKKEETLAGKQITTTTIDMSEFCRLVGNMSHSPTAFVSYERGGLHEKTPDLSSVALSSV